MAETEITIKTYKYDGSLHRSWQADLIERDGDLLVFKGVFDSEIIHDKLGTIQKGTISYEYYWLDRWYNVFRFHEPDGAFRNFYCNINMPPKFADGVLEYVDLDIDILVNVKGVQILDELEFAEHSVRYGYSTGILKKVKSTTADLLHMIDQKIFPFAGN
jgi:protein associated with RNAse G/E